MILAPINVHIKAKLARECAASQAVVSLLDSPPSGPK